MPSTHETPLRPLVVLVFLPGLYLVLLLVAALSMFLGAEGIRLGISIMRHAPIMGVMTSVTCGLAAGAGVCSAVVAARQSLKAKPVRVTALKVGRQDAAGIWELIAKVSRRLKTSPPRNLILEFGPAIFVTDSLVKTFDATLAGRTLCISAPLLRVLTPAELESVLAHELAHFTGDDTLYSRYFYPIYEGSVRALGELHEAFHGGWHDLILMLPTLLVAGYLRLFAGIEKGISRKRELRADAIAAEVSGKEAIAQALAKVCTYGSLWSVTYDWMVGWLKENNAFINVPVFFVDYVQRDPQLLARAFEAADPPVHPFNSHPTFLDRVYALGIQRIQPQLTAGAQNAASLFPELEQFEQRLTELYTLEIMNTRPGHFFTKRKQPELDVMAMS
jgi:Zn-dependent protease with chaperone function